MNDSAASIYPEYLKTGLDKLQTKGVSSDFATLFTALENFRRDLHGKTKIEGILETTHNYLCGLNLFRVMSFYLLNPTDMGFELSFCQPEDHRALIKERVHQEIRSGHFAWALKQNTPVVFQGQIDDQSCAGIFHSLTVSTHVVGMFCGLLSKERIHGQDIGFNLLTILLGTCSDAIAANQNSSELKKQILATHRDLQRMLQENEILARIPGESPAPVLRLHRNGQVLYCNKAGEFLLQQMGIQVGDIIVDEWQHIMQEAFELNSKREFDTHCNGLTLSFVVAAIKEEGYANFYGTDITARKLAEAERERLIVQLQEALVNVKTLSGLLPICAWCKKVRDDQGYWKQIEQYIEVHSDASFSHGVCPDCAKKIVTEFAAKSAVSPQK